MEDVFQDKDGRTIKLSVEHSKACIYFKMMFQRGAVASAIIWKEGDVAILKDLFVDDEFFVRQQNLWKRMLGHKTSSYNFRGQGIGKRLLMDVIKYAQTNGFKRIEGEMNGVNKDPDVDLPRWYRKRGFEVKGAHISMDLFHL
ncbi:MAG TPA: GNAT family N-acetyltransferase [Verrucomicrobiae bacterium]|nr:GNAT family N-acetyltransferase [Verrucomicrobiae bacterium]